MSARPVYASDLFRLADRFQRKVDALALRCPEISREEIRGAMFEAVARRIAPEIYPAIVAMRGGRPQ
jgi:hypothetical protein